MKTKDQSQDSTRHPNVSEIYFFQVVRSNILPPHQQEMLTIKTTFLFSIMQMKKILIAAKTLNHNIANSTNFPSSIHKSNTTAGKTYWRFTLC